jgi:iron-sulfur cluster repair protein YtfE (RIC family)
MMVEWQNLRRIDPVRKQAERQSGEGQGLSPMDPPDAYAPPSLKPIPAAELHPFLGQIKEAHAALAEQLNTFEETILAIQKVGYTKESDSKLKHFFHYFDQEFTAHSRHEEATLFPLLHERLLAAGEHSKAAAPTTAIDLIREEHAKAAQLAAVVVNFLGLVFRLPDQNSRLVVLDAALEQGRNLVELLRLHVFREDNIVFSLAHRLISPSEFDAMQSRKAAARTSS